MCKVSRNNDRRESEERLSAAAVLFVSRYDDIDAVATTTTIGSLYAAIVPQKFAEELSSRLKGRARHGTKANVKSDETARDNPTDKRPVAPPRVLRHVEI